MEDYKKECDKRKARAEKFGTDYVAPKLEDFLPWTDVKRIREAEKKLGLGGDDTAASTTTPKGFATGIDLTDAKEIDKQEARKARFAKAYASGKDKNDGDDAGEEGTDKEEDSKPAADVPTQDLPVTECWDKEEMLSAMRSDPPPAMWIRPLEPMPPVEGSNVEEDSIIPDADKEMKEATTWVPEKIHLCSIDWAAFKQIRNKDLLAYFTDYGPTYVEWLGDVSCNVCFEDQYTAKRALMALGQEIPSPPPPPPPPPQQQQLQQEALTIKELPDFGNMTWRFCRRPIRKVRRETLVFRHALLGTHAFFMNRWLTTNMEGGGRPREF